MNHGSLSLRSGVLYVARHEQTAHVRPYDLDGRALGAGFSFRGPHGEACELGGIEVDSDHQVWIADGASNALRAFSLFGRETRVLPGATLERDDARGLFRGAVDVAVSERDDRRNLWVGLGGWRRHALQLVREDGTFVDSLRPQGNPLARFNGVVRIAALDEHVFVCERAAGQVQVFREGEFHFAFRIATRPGVRFEPVAVAPLPGGRCLLATGGIDSALLLVDAAGRLVRVLAECGEDHGQVREPGDVVVEVEALEARARVAVIDRDAERVQVFSLLGECHGQIDELPGQKAGGAE
ncbi:MAG: hypothetical protein IT454_01245 [Planctomycetes bacterium]|nr:hypothetical protein [Planctomycetota bacterium]